MFPASAGVAYPVRFLFAGRDKFTMDDCVMEKSVAAMFVIGFVVVVLLFLLDG